MSCNLHIRVLTQIAIFVLLYHFIMCLLLRLTSALISTNRLFKYFCRMRLRSCVLLTTRFSHGNSLRSRTFCAGKIYSHKSHDWFFSLMRWMHDLSIDWFMIWTDGSSSAKSPPEQRTAFEKEEQSLAPNQQRSANAIAIIAHKLLSWMLANRRLDASVLAVPKPISKSKCSFCIILKLQRVCTLKLCTAPTWKFEEVASEARRAANGRADWQRGQPMSLRTPIGTIRREGTRDETPAKLR